MYIYCITNLLNNKKYIGSTNNVERRWAEHVNASKWPSCQSYNFPLQCAFRKYGVKNFSFNILESDLLIEETPNKELYYINKYNTLTNTGWGYNQTQCTDSALRDPAIHKQQLEKVSKRCALVDYNMNILEIYNSLHDASRINFNQNEASNIREVCIGEKYSYNNKIFRFLDEDNCVIPVINQTRKRRTQICGISIFNKLDIIYFDSILQASEKLNIPRRSLQQCIQGSSRYTCVHDRIWRVIENDKIVDNQYIIDDIIYQHNGYCSIDKNSNIEYYKTLAEINHKYGIAANTIKKYISTNEFYKNKKWYKLDANGKPGKEMMPDENE